MEGNFVLVAENAVGKKVGIYTSTQNLRWITNQLKDFSLLFKQKEVNTNNLARDLAPGEIEARICRLLS